MIKAVYRSDLYGLKIDSGAQRVSCRSLRFLACPPESRGQTRRKVDASRETIPVGAKAEAIYLLGMYNHGWDHGLAHWGEHPEFKKDRPDRILIGDALGGLEIKYADSTSDIIPLVMGATIWSVSHWAFGPSNSVMKPVKEPFASRPEYAAVLRESLLLHEDGDVPRDGKEYAHFYLALKPRPKKIREVIIHDNESIRGRPLVSAITLASPEPVSGLEYFGTCTVFESALETRLDVTSPANWSRQLHALSRAMYTREEDLPDRVSLLDFPDDLDAVRIRFLGGGRWGDMLSNIWVANLTQMDQKFVSGTGFFGETGTDTPWYGGYQGIGTWAPDTGVYSRWCYGRSSDHLATVVLRCVHDPQRWTSFVDYVDGWLYFYRTNHDPDKGPPNETLDIESYPEDAPPHWGFVMNVPGSWPKWLINEIPGDEEMDGHGATAVARYLSWRMMGCPVGDWLTTPRDQVYGKSRWDSTRDAAEFICWLMDYTGRDVIWSEGESTGWGGGPQLLRVPKNMPDKTDANDRIKKYAEANMYEVYPTHVCMVALRCSAEIAGAMAEDKLAAKWRSYADRIRDAMIKDLTIGEGPDAVWRCTLSVFPSGQEALAPAWFAGYFDGCDPLRWDPQIAAITRNYLRRQLASKPGTRVPLAMGYGQGWLTHAALLLDEMDAAGECLTNIARYTYDKNMNYVDEARGIDWRKWLWIVPEGTHVLPDGSWYRVGDLSNGANQGPAIHALEACAGVDDTDLSALKILPRVPEPLTGIEVSNFLALVQQDGEVRVARIAFTYVRDERFTLSSDLNIPHLAIRLGPFGSDAAARAAIRNGASPDGSTHRIVASGRFRGTDAYWLWVENLADTTSVSISLSAE